MIETAWPIEPRARPTNPPVVGTPLWGFLTLFRALRVYLRYEVVGLAHLLDGPASLIVGYHGRPLALDQCILATVLHDRLGYLPHGLIHGHFVASPILRRGIDGLGFLDGDSPAVQEAIDRGEHLMVQPGGTREGCRSVRFRYCVDWGERIGYLRLALKYQLPIVPVGGRGMDDLYLGLNDGYRLGKRLGAPARLPVWLGIGLGGLWPLALPFPVKVVQRIGPPIDTHLCSGFDGENPSHLRAVHEDVKAAVQTLLARTPDRRDRGAA